MLKIERNKVGWLEMKTDRISRGILIGGALGAFAAIFGLSESMFMSIGFGMIAGFFAGLTLTWKERKRGGKK